MSLATDIRDAARTVGSSADAAAARVTARVAALEARIQELIDADSTDAPALQEALDELHAADPKIDAISPDAVPEPPAEPPVEPVP